MEAAAQGIKLGPEDWAVRCNLVTIEDQVMRDFTADHISTEEATKLLATAQEQIASDAKYRGALEFVPGVSYRNLLIWRGAKLPAPFTNETRTRRRTTSPTNRCSKITRAARAATCCAT